MNKDVAAVIVTYNRKELLLECLEEVKNQTQKVDAIFLIDNLSSDGTPDLLYNKKYIPLLPEDNKDQNQIIESELSISGDSIENIKLYYVRKCQNDGGAGGFYEGMSLACEKNYKWLWIMDDDAIPYNDSLEKLMIYSDDSLSGLASTVIDINNNIDLNHRLKFNYNLFKKRKYPVSLKNYKLNETIEIDVASYVGFLINASAINHVGYPRKDFFIFYDDTEHCLRLKKYGPIILVSNSRIKHLAKIGERKPMDANWKTYYQYRNRLITINLHFGHLFLVKEKLMIYLKIFTSSILGNTNYAKQLKNSLKDFKKMIN